MQITDETTSDGVIERSFTVDGPQEPVPGVLWTPSGAAGPRPLVLFGHGGIQHKRADNIVALANSFVRENGYAAVSIDQGLHGDRVPPEARGLSQAEQQQLLLKRLRADGLHQKAAELAVADWAAVLAAVEALPDLEISTLGYWGLSMGTRYGVPLIVSQPRITAAVLGLFGWAQTPALAEFATAAKQIAIPTLFLAQWDDELVARDHAFALFDLFPAPIKTLHANPGRHVEVPRIERRAALEFFAQHLGRQEA